MFRDRQYTLSFFSFSLVLSFAHTLTSSSAAAAAAAAAVLLCGGLFMCACLPLPLLPNSTAANGQHFGSGHTVAAQSSASARKTLQVRQTNDRTYSVSFWDECVCVCERLEGGGEELAGVGRKPTGSVALFLSLSFLFLPNELAHWK